MLGRRAWSKRCPLLQRAPRPVGELDLSSEEADKTSTKTDECTDALEARGGPPAWGAEVKLRMLLVAEQR